MTQFEQNFLESATRYFRESTNKPIDWEQRRYEIAKDAIVGLLMNWGAQEPASLAPSAVKYADALIEELKK